MADVAVLQHAYDKVLLDEAKLLQRRPNTFVQQHVAPLVGAIEERIPAKLQEALDLAFYKGFQGVFEKGLGLIEKTYDKDTVTLEYMLKNHRLAKGISPKSLKSLDYKKTMRKLSSTALSTAEGVGLGVLGIGLPDIPLFIGMMLKSVYEIALSFGYEYTDPLEQLFILRLIRVAASDGQVRRAHFQMLSLTAQALDRGDAIQFDLDLEMKKTAKVLSDAMLIAKFVQGFPIVGAIGGLTNPQIMASLNDYANLAYKKRYLQRQLAAMDHPVSRL